MREAGEQAVSDDQSKRDVVVEGLIPPGWDRGPYDWAILIRDFLSTIPGVSITGSGSGDGFADCSFVIDDKGFWVEVQCIGFGPDA